MRINRQSGFSLLEVLVAVAVTAMLVALMGQIFAGSSLVWKRGTGNVELNAVGRAVLEVIARDLSSATADSRLAFYSESDNFALFNNGAVAKPDSFNTDEIKFVSFAFDPATKDDRVAQTIRYWVKESTVNPGIYELHRATQGAATFNVYADTYDLPTPDSGGRSLADNVAEFVVWCYDEDANVVADYRLDDATPLEDRKPPAWIDIYLLLMTREHAQRAAHLNTQQNGQVARDYVDRNSRGYMTRVHLRNGPGYHAEK